MYTEGKVCPQDPWPTYFINVIILFINKIRKKILPQNSIQAFG